ncbi:YdbC family protein [Anaerovibrio lipolyticus]|uniref:YdbC family protein n=1 Tax=Anaerovibrio lipolyticus TaxID=82374 RepID=UPI0025FCC575|nr:YdbC family protein [Anaerovibrio lipolyticus]
MAKDFSYEIIENIGILSTSPKGWTKDLNLISWNGKAPKYDIRDWSPEHEKMGKGVTLSDEEVSALLELLKKVEP